MKKEKRNYIVKSQGDKIDDCMNKFKAGRLKDSAGNIVTDRAQAIAIGLSEAGLSKDLHKAEIRNKLKMYRGQLNNILKKELLNDQSIKAEIIKFFKITPFIKDSDVHALAERLQIPPDQIEEHIYNILRSFLAGGKSQGKVEQVDPNELAMGIKVESEHTDDPALQEKIARDHLAENPKYYTDLQKIEKPPEGKPLDPAMDDEAQQMAGELPGDVPRESEELFATVYAACRKGGGDKQKCSQLAWSEVQNSSKISIAN